jgi:hypothetical protein
LCHCGFLKLAHQIIGILSDLNDARMPAVFFGGKYGLRELSKHMSAIRGPVTVKALDQ